MQGKEHTMQNALEHITQLLGVSLVHFIGAFALLLVGWLFALAVSGIVRRALHHTRLDNRLVGWLFKKQEADRPIPVEQWVASGVFYLIMLFVLVGFFQQLQLQQVSEPINRLLNQLFEFAPRLLSAGLLLAMAWVVATVLRQATLGLARVAKFQEQLAAQAGLQSSSLPKALAESAYWFVFLLFLPGVLNALNLDGLLQPIQNVTEKILGFLPNAATAVVILAVGWFVARIAQGAAGNLLAALGTDTLSEKVGLSPALGGKKLSGVLGSVTCGLLFIPAIVAALDALALEALAKPVSGMLNRMLEAVPLLFAALLVLTVAYIGGKVASGWVSTTLANTGFDDILAKLGLSKRVHQEGARTPSRIVGILALAGILLFAVTESAQMLGLTALADLTTQFMSLAGRILLGIVMFGVGLYLANAAASTILASAAVQPNVLAAAARFAILSLSAAMSLTQMGLGEDIVKLAFGLLLAAIAAALAIAFGLGGRDVAARHLDTWVGTASPFAPKRSNPSQRSERT